MTYDNKSSADLEREVKAQRERVEARIGEIKDRLSPGQLIDEALAYTKDGGAHFASNLGSQMTANPLPVALIGIGLAWLMSPKPESSAHFSSSTHDEDSYPYARASGIRRVRHAADEAGDWWSEFETDTGDIYKARSNAEGHRAGHFTDKAGRMFSGFIDDAGNRVRQIQDEAGNTLSDAQGWASHSWRSLQHGVGHAFSGVRSAASDAMSGTRHLGGDIRSQSEDITRQVARMFDQQPLIAGALAFAAGAALGAALPHTDQEDQLVGKPADKLRREAGKAAGNLYKAGKEQAADLYDQATDTAGRIYSDAKDEVAGTGPGATSPFKH